MIIPKGFKKLTSRQYLQDVIVPLNVLVFISNRRLKVIDNYGTDLFFLHLFTLYSSLMNTEILKICNTGFQV